MNTGCKITKFTTSVTTSENYITERLNPPFKGGYVLLSIPGTDAEVIDIEVAERFRGRGLGRALMNRLIDAARVRGAPRIFLEVAQDNLAAISLYTGLGFTKIDTRKNYYGEGRHAFILSLIL